MDLCCLFCMKRSKKKEEETHTKRVCILTQLGEVITAYTRFHYTQHDDEFRFFPILFYDFVYIFCFFHDLVYRLAYYFYTNKNNKNKNVFKKKLALRIVECSIFFFSSLEYKFACFLKVFLLVVFFFSSLF